MSYINKSLCTNQEPVLSVNSSVFRGFSNSLGLQLLLLFSSLNLAVAQELNDGLSSFSPSVNCEQPVILGVSTAQETACGNQDGKVSIQIQNDERGATYTVVLTQDKTTYEYQGLSASNGTILIQDIVPAGFKGLQVIREQDDCASAFLEQYFLVEHACLPASMRTNTCSGGDFPHQNCEMQTININGSNITAQSYMYLDDDYLGCIGYVNANCEIGQEEDVYCGDHQLSEPTPNNGYDYGDVLFTKETGLVSNLGISELDAERINWIMCNGPAQGYSKSDINNAIWHFSSGRNNCNNLCQAAQSAVNTVQGGIDSQMEVYIPDNSNIQPFIVNSCACVATIDGLFVNDDNGDNNVLEITDGAQLDLNALPNNFRLEAELSGLVGSVKFTISGDDSNTNTENSAPYNAPGGSNLWNPGAGNYTVNIKVYSLPNAGGVLCAEQTISFSIFPGGTPPVPTTPAPDNWAYGCDDSVIIDFYGSGANCADNPDAEVVINNTAGAFQTVVEVVYKNQYPGSTVVVTAGGTNYSLPQVDISGTSSNVYVYRGLIAAPVGSVSHNTETSGCGNQNGLQSLTAYAFRNTTIKRASSGAFTELSGYCDLQTFSINIPTDDQSRDLSVLLPISELTDDGRFLTIRATAGGVTASTTIFGPDGECCQGAPVINLQDVPGSASSVEIEVDTRSSQNPNGSGCGQSWVIAGLTYVDVICPEPLVADYGDAPDSYGSICYYIDDANPTRLGATVDSDDNFQSSANADGDDNDGNNDDDGVTFTNPSGLTAGASESVTVTWSTNDNDSYISAWIDFNQNGTFDASEKVIDDFKQGAFNNTTTGSESFTFTVPSDAACGATFARFIITSDPNEGPTGDFCNSGDASDDGEVEDYQVTIISGLEAMAGADVSVCTGGDVQLLASASGGTGVYTFEWSNGLGTGASQTVSPVSNQTYTVTVTDANGCSDTDEVMVTVTPAPQLSLTSMCWQDGDINGTHVMRTRNENDFDIDFDVYYSGGLQETYTIPANSEYFFPVPDVNSVTIKWTPYGCGEQSTTKALNQEPCKGELFISKVVEGQAVPGGVEYTVEVVDENGDVVATVMLEAGETSAKIILPGQLAYGPTPLFTGLPNSGVPYPGGITYTINETNDQGAQSVDYNIQIGAVEDPNDPNYPVYQTINGNTFVLTKGMYIEATVTNNFPDCDVSVAMFSTDTGCNNNTGTASADPSGGTAPYTYEWNNGAGTSSVSSLSAGIYTVTVTDAFGCTATGQVEVGTTTGPLANIECVDDPVVHRTASNSSKTCQSLVYGFYTGNMLNNWTGQKHWTISDTDFKEYSNGTAVMSATAVNNGDANLIFNINVVFAGRTYTTPSNSPKENTQCVGNLDNSDWYYYTVTKGNMAGAGDLAGAQVSFTRQGPAFQVGTGANLNDASKFGASGWLDLQINSQPASGPALIAGAMGDFNINLSGATLPEELASGCLEICVGESVELFANATAGAPGYMYQWSTGATSAQITVTPVETTTYTLTVTDANGCADVATATVTVNDPPSLTVNGTDATCGATNGSAEAAASGNAPFNYEWSTGATTALIEDLSAGTYTVTVTDANGCQNEGSVTINNIGGPSLSISATDADCFGAPTGSVSLTVDGGTAPFTYEWSNSASTKDLTDVPAGNYSVTVTDANGCEATEAATVAEPADLVLGITGEDVDCFGANTGSANLTVSGGTMPYTYDWSNGASTQNIDNLVAGTYTVTVTDANGCE
ncbi:MAG: GEVED domain-containing protein, partial [Phaeodactylibacter sp.]|uniref:GEVED domain-containing protein n=1 Tax=Phaeodactylibacter sp. TaxID=1940289 RepID=UPI0032ECC8B9